MSRAIVWAVVGFAGGLITQSLAIAFTICILAAVASVATLPAIASLITGGPAVALAWMHEWVGLALMAAGFMLVIVACVCVVAGARHAAMRHSVVVWRR